jgi:hypothetical protein
MIKFNRNFNVNFYAPFKVTDTDQVIAVKAAFRAKRVSFSIGLPFSLEFDVERNTMSSANTCRMKLFNLSERTRDAIFKDKLDVLNYKGVELSVGYGDALSSIFRGNILEAHSYKEKVDWVTEVTCQDGGFGMANSFSNFTVPAGVPKSEVIKKCIGDLKCVEPGKVGLTPEVSKRGQSILSNTTDFLTDYTQHNFFIDDETAYSVANNEYLPGDIPIISLETGLLGTPLKEETFVKVKMIMEPRLKAGRLAQLLSTTYPFLNGVYKILGFTHLGLISPVKCGEATTSVTLSFGTGILRMVA